MDIPKDKKFLNYFDVMKVLNVGKTKAYKIIRNLNIELEETGYLIERGKVPKTYFCERYKID